MTRVDFARLDALFHDALGQPESTRAAFVAAACGDDLALRERLAAMLAQDAGADSDADPGADRLARAVDAGRRQFGAGVEAMPERIGPFRLRRVLGQGGMGTVYLGERDRSDFQQLVAIKLLRRLDVADHDSGRLRRERALLARLTHPNIAQLIDGGELDDGTPWVAMEYVEGVGLTRHARDRQLGINARLQLFEQLLDAVAYAHRHLIVHRDIKPENVLVDGDGTLKLLDFGIAKLLDDESSVASPATMTVAAAMTPCYASPEQLQGQAVSTQSDVYSLGVVLYELLTGQLPFAPEPSLSPLAFQQRICTTQPTAPSRVVDAATPRRRLRGDLDNIVLMAMRKELHRRYVSADALADDLRRHREGRPVAARPDSVVYHLTKFVTRNPAGVAASVLLLGTLVAFAVTSRWQAVQIAAERDRAEQEAMAANQVTEAMIDLFRVPDPVETANRDLSARQLLDRAAAALPAQMQDAPLLRARMLHVIGMSYANIGDYGSAVRLLDEALAIRESEPGTSSLEVADTLNRLGDVYRMYGHLELAEPLLVRALSIREALGTGPDPDLADSYNNVGLLQYELGHDDDALLTLKKSIEMHRKISQPDTLLVAVALHNRTLALVRQKRYAEAEQQIDEAISIKQRLGFEGRATLMNSLGLRAQILVATDRDDEALAIRETTLQRRRELYPEGHPALIGGLISLAQLKLKMGHPEQAAPLLNEAEQWANKIDPVNGGGSGLLTARVRLAQGRLAVANADNAAARERFGEAIALYRSALPAGHPDLRDAEALLDSVR